MGNSDMSIVGDLIDIEGLTFCILNFDLFVLPLVLSNVLAFALMTIFQQGNIKPHYCLV